MTVAIAVKMFQQKVVNNSQKKIAVKKKQEAFLYSGVSLRKFRLGDEFSMVGDN